MAAITSIQDAMNLEGDKGFRRKPDKVLVSTHNLVKPKVAMTADDRKAAIEKMHVDAKVEPKAESKKDDTKTEEK